jgi:hypothetical protein
VEHMGAEYLVILNDPQLRAGFIADIERSRWSAQKSLTSVRLRFRLAHILRCCGLAHGAGRTACNRNGIASAGVRRVIGVHEGDRHAV